MNSNSKTTSKISLWRRSGGRNFVPFSFAVGLFFVFAASLVAQVYPTKLGDLNVDGQVDVRDLVLLLNHLNRSQPATPEITSSLLPFANIDQDAFINQQDVDALTEIILGTRPVQEFPFARVLETSPASGEAGVTVTRETVFRLTQPLGTNSLVTKSNLYATFGGRQILARCELSSDRRTVTLFYQENLPASARVRVTFGGSNLRDFLGRPFDLDGDGQPGGIAQVDFDTLSNTPIPGTAVIGQVFASELVLSPGGEGGQNSQYTNRPLAGVTITVDGMEETLRAVTDTNGFFRLSPCPAGEFFVHIDGRTLINVAAGIRYPDLAYYPFVGKAWNAVAGRTNNLAGDTGLIYLPLIKQGTLQAVSATVETLITFPTETLLEHPELAGVSITVPANALLGENGTRGGRVGIAPVPPDRLPGPLPAGVFLPLVITVQTDGPSNFDRPVPVMFPNLPDPETGVTLPPGATTALVSFNHDTGDWEIAGTMTISADGKFAVSDPGSGIRQPGWHGTSPLSSGSGGGYGGNGSGGGPGGPGGGNNGGGPPAGEPEGGGDDDDSTPPGPNSPGDSGDGDGDGDEEDQPDDDDNPDPDPEGGDGGCAVSAQVALKPPSTEEIVGFQPQGEASAYQVRGRQLIRIITPKDVTVVASGTETFQSGENNEDQTRITILSFPLNIAVSVHEKRVRLIRAATDELPGCIKEILFRVLPNSGSHWVSQFEGSRDTTGLNEPFRGNVERFVAALRAGGASVSMASTFRPQKRAYLMHHSGKLAKLRNSQPLVEPPAYDPNNAVVMANCDGAEGCVGPLTINWLHLDRDGRIDRTATKAAAAAMMSAYHIAFPAGFPGTRHSVHRAIDMTIDWPTTSAVFKWPDGVVQPDGTTVGGNIVIPNASCFGQVETEDGEIIDATFNNNCNTLLHQLGAAYGVKKLVIDPPHWSDDGR